MPVETTLWLYSFWANRVVLCFEHQAPFVFILLSFVWSSHANQLHPLPVPYPLGYLVGDTKLSTVGYYLAGPRGKWERVYADNQGWLPLVLV